MTILVKMAKMAVNYHNKHGGICPNCSVEKACIIHTCPWLDDTKVRRHKCKYCGYSFTSIQDAEPAPKKPVILQDEAVKVMAEKEKPKALSKSRRKSKTRRKAKK